MRILTIASQKGGTGKTTLAAHLSVEAERSKAGPVAVIDTDPQGSLAAWWNTREATTPHFAAVNIAQLNDHVKRLQQQGKVAPVTLHHRVDFAASMTDGRTVAELAPESPSAQEITSLWKYVSA